MLVLFESPAGYAIFKVLDESKIEAADDLYEHFKTAQSASKLLKLTRFRKFDDTTEALAATTAAVEGKLSKPLKKVLKKVIASEAHEKLAVADAKLGQAIKEKMGLPCVYSPAVQELMRGIRAHVNSLITGLPERDMTAMALGLAHSLSRYKLKFSPDKVDTMIVQAIALLDDLDKELNNYIMRCREWYGWHFPELGKVVTDHTTYAKIINLMGFRTNAQSTDFSEILSEDIEAEVKAQSLISMGTEISDDDLENIQYLAEQILEISQFREQLFDYLKNRMSAIAPNLSIMVGEVVGARLIAHAGSLLNLAKHPASTVQILGAEKALFRALKTQKQTPKYGLIYHASLVSNSNPKNKGKISRMLAAKCALAVRYDALADESSTSMGIDNLTKLEQRLKFLESGKSKRISKGGKSYQGDSWTNQGEVRTYPTALDSTLPAPTKRKREEQDAAQEENKSSLLIVDGDMQEPPKKKKIKTDTETPAKKKKKKTKSLDESETSQVKIETPAETPKKKKKKSKTSAEADNSQEKIEAVEETPVSALKKKKKTKSLDESETSQAKIETPAETPKKKKKKSKTSAEADNSQEKIEAVEETPVSALKKKKKTKSLDESETSQAKIETPAETPKKKKKKSKTSAEADNSQEKIEAVEETPVSALKKKRKKEVAEEGATATPVSVKKKKKKAKSEE